MNRSKIALMITMVLFAVVCQIPGESWALVEDSDRGDRWELYFPITAVDSDSIDAKGGSSVDLDSSVGFGFGFAYNFSERFSLGFEASFRNVDFEARVVDDLMGVTVLSGDLDSATAHFTAQYNFLEKTITPYIRAGLGGSYTDTNIPDGPVQGACWWDPWWGYVCDTWQETKDDTSFSYGAGGGVRADLTDRFYLDLSVNKIWIDFDNADNPDFTGARLKFGWMF